MFASRRLVWRTAGVLIAVAVVAWSALLSSCTSDASQKPSNATTSSSPAGASLQEATRTDAEILLCSHVRMAFHVLQWLDSTAEVGVAEPSFGTQLLREIAVSFSRDESLLSNTGADDTTEHAIATARLDSAALASAISVDAKRLALANALSAIRALNIMNHCSSRALS